MSTITPPQEQKPGHRFHKTGRMNSDLFMRIGAAAGAWVILLMLVALISVVTAAAIPSIRAYGAHFLFSSEWQPNRLPILKLGPNGKPIKNHGRNRFTEPWVIARDASGQPMYTPERLGALAPVVGTIQSSIIGLIVAVPLSLGAAIFLVRLAPRRLKGPVSFLIEFLAAIPSIAYGLWGMFVLQPWLGGPPRWFGKIPTGGMEAHLRDWFGNWPGLHWIFYTTGANGNEAAISLTGRDIFCGGLVLGIMIVPIITAISRDVLANVPRAQIEGAIALGATWWQSCKEMLKYSRSGLFGGIMLGLARASGETMAVLMVMGSTVEIAKSPFQGGTTMSALIASLYSEAATDEIQRGALMEIALILLAMSLLFNVAARYLVVGGASSRTAMAV
ncbi:MAG TPA: phosphate ABC transporter permease subunit PstC [Tepidisphaeraceae bacterium]|nr:phosphate ABC transporter permease subunit PstC [Tepidisphaeraceae bacterium]